MCLTISYLHEKCRSELDFSLDNRMFACIEDSRSIDYCFNFFRYFGRDLCYYIWLYFFYFCYFIQPAVFVKYCLCVLAPIVFIISTIIVDLLRLWITSDEAASFACRSASPFLKYCSVSVTI